MDGAAARLEAGEIVALPDRGFPLSAGELAQVTGPLALGAAKSISFDPASREVRGVRATGGQDADIGLLAGLLGRYAAFARALVLETAPGYAAALRTRRTSLRIRPAEGPALSARQDDRRLHADAFPANPTGGERILRVFSNINPDGAARIWRVGEPFADYARRWLNEIPPQRPGEARLLQALGITRGRRTAYDALMLGLHDRAKGDVEYQREAPAREVAFPAGSSWIVYTDAVVHAAVSGRLALEQTFTLPIAAMADPGRSPLRILERLTGRTLA